MLEHLTEAALPPSKLHPADWASKWVPVENSERSTKFDIAQLRWWRKPMGWMADRDTRHIVCLCPTGSGKSTMFEAIGCWIVSESPGSMMYITQTDDDAEFWGETRYIKALEGCEPINPLWPSDRRSKIRKDAHIWPHMFSVFGGANSSNLQEKSITYGLGDEAWAWKPGRVREFYGRHHNRANRKFVLASQGGEIATEEGIGQTSELHLEEAKCRKWEFAWQCKCGSVQPFRFEQLRWDEVKRPDGVIDDQASADSCVRGCENPDCKHVYADTPANRRALYDSYQEEDGYLNTDPNGLRGYEGARVDAGAIWWIPWSDDVLQKIAADRQMELGDHTQLKQWTQKRRAKGWNDAQMVTKFELKTSGYTQGDYEKARKIENEKLRIMTVDAGLDHWWVVIRAWAHGASSKLLYCGYVGREADLAKLAVDYDVPANHVFKDVGYQQAEMAEIIARYGWRGIKGKGEDGNNITRIFDWEILSGPDKGKIEKRLFSRPWLAKSTSGKRVQCYHMTTEQLQHILQRLIEGKGAPWLAYDDCPPSYAKHLNGERLENKKNGRGQTFKKWTRHGPNHLRDCEVMNLCVAFMFKVFKPAPQDLKESEALEVIAETGA